MKGSGNDDFANLEVHVVVKGLEDSLVLHPPFQLDKHGLACATNGWGAFDKTVCARLVESEPGKSGHAEQKCAAIPVLIWKSTGRLGAGNDGKTGGRACPRDIPVSPVRNGFGLEIAA